MPLSPDFDDEVRPRLTTSSFKFSRQPKGNVCISNQAVAINLHMFCHVVAGKRRTPKVATFAAYNIATKTLECFGQWLYVNRWNLIGPLLPTLECDRKHLVRVNLKFAS